jgi:hypothetical protein
VALEQTRHPVIRTSGRIGVKNLGHSARQPPVAIARQIDQHFTGVRIGGTVDHMPTSRHAQQRRL